MPRRQPRPAPTRTPDETCRTRKKVYETDLDALRELVAIRNRPYLLGRPKQEQRAYKCTFCGGYHLTARPAAHDAL